MRLEEMDCACPVCGRQMPSEIALVFDIEEVYENCTVQVLRNSVTGLVSIGYVRNGGAGDGV